MTTFADMRLEVIANTKRPELVSLTDSAIRMATLRAHQVDFFSRDYASAPITYIVPVTNSPFVDVLNIYNIAPVMRTPDFMQALDATTLLPAENMEYVPSYKDFWDEYNCLRGSVFTFMGSTMRFRSLANTGKLNLFYYNNPQVSEVGYDSWIANLYKEELAKWAAAIIWMRSGFQEIAQQMQKESIEPFKQMLVESHLSSKV